MISDRAVTVLTKLLVACLLGVMIVASSFSFIEGDLSAGIASVLGLYIGVVLAVGVFTERLFDTRLQIAFAVGFVAWGMYIYVDHGSVLGGILVLAGVFYLVDQLHELVVE
jgi:uncharacterized membrane protein